MAYPNEPEELDLDFGDEPADPNADQEVVVKSYERTPLPVRGRMTTAEDFARIRATLIAHRASKGRNPDGTKAERFRYETDEAPVTITTPGHLIDPSELPQSSRLIAKRALAKGWEVQCAHSCTHVAATLFQGDSPEGPEDPHAAGDVRYPAEDREHHTVWGVLAADERQVARFRIHYQTRPSKSTKSGVATAFVAAFMWDQFSGPAFSLRGGDFDDWFDILVPREKPRKPKDTRSKEEKTNDALLGGEEWS